jgi:hypothetical protein
MGLLYLYLFQSIDVVLSGGDKNNPLKGCETMGKEDGKTDGAAVSA